jgi:hypothetical protein
VLDDETVGAHGEYLREKFSLTVGLATEQEHRHPHLIRAIRGMPAFLALLMPASPAEPRADLVAALGANTTLGDRRLGRLQSWIWDPLHGDGRLPPGMSEDAVGRVLRMLAGAPTAQRASTRAATAAA